MTDALLLILSREDKESENKIKERYNRWLKGRDWTVKIDDSIIGGFIIIDGDYVLDSSISGQLHRIKRKLLEV